MRIAIEGCCHGELDNIYATIEEAQALAPEGSPKVDLLLICGDFQAIRNPSDLLALAVPEKYRQLGGFYRYYSGEKVAPVLTLVIGGNHEASNYMWELFHGGWLAPNIYYLGAAGSVLVNGVRISGASGIYKSPDYRKGRHEGLPYDRSTIRSTYHTRQYDIDRLKALPLIGARPTVVLSHDWPLEIERFGDTGALIRKKPFFKDEIDSNTLGSPPLRDLLETLRPQYWFAAHLHVKFAALFKHNRDATTVRYPPRQPHQPIRNGKDAHEKSNPDELLIDEDDDAEGVGEGDDGMDALMAELERKEAELSRQAAEGASAHVKAANPDELALPDDEEDTVDEDTACAGPSASAGSTGPLQVGLTDVIPENGIDESVTVLEKTVDNPDQIMMDEDDEEFEQAVVFTAPPAAGAGHATAVNASGEGRLNTEAAATRFLALSKCLPGQDFLQFLDIPTPSDASASPPLLAFDPYWLAITRAFQPLLSLSAHQPPLPADPTVRKGTIESHLAWVRQTLPGGGEGIEIASVQQFQMTAPAPGTPGGDVRGPGPWYTNPQTEALCEMLGLKNKVNPVPEEVRLARRHDKLAQQQQQQQQQGPAPEAEVPKADTLLAKADSPAV